MSALAPTPLGGVDESGTYSRRAALRLGAAFVAAIATLTTTSKVSATDCQHSPCCHLASCTKCQVAPCSGWYCPVGYRNTCWNCSSGGSWYMCGECSAGSTCYTGPWACSIWSWEAGPGCPQ
jgi:hypothetical protein